MTVRNGLIVILPQSAERAPMWMRVVDNAVVQRGAGVDWLAACGLREWPADAPVMLVVPVEAAAYHWIAMPDLPVRQSRAAARLAALDASIGQPETLIAATDQQDDPAAAHLIAVAARSDMQHWLLWAQHHGIDPDTVIPSALVLPSPAAGFVRGQIGHDLVLRSADTVLPADDPLATLLTEHADIVGLSDQDVTDALVSALNVPPVNLRQGDFAKRTRTTIDTRQLARIAMWCGVIALISLLIAVIMIVKLNADASRLDEESVTIARKVLPNANDAEAVEQDINSRLSASGNGAYGFSGSTAGLMAAMRVAPGVSLTILDRAADGTVKATLAAPKADDINMVLLALQASGFTITATSSSDPSGRVLADITVQP